MLQACALGMSAYNAMKRFYAPWSQLDCVTRSYGGCLACCGLKGLYKIVILLFNIYIYIYQPGALSIEEMLPRRLISGH